jgi:4-alpha-glucanotransferase
VEFPRACGVLLHPTSLPGPFGVGDLGPAAHRYVDWLAEAGASWWQVLPLQSTGHGDSPYAAVSSFDGNPLLISPEALVADGLLAPDDLPREPFPEGRVDFGRVIDLKERLVALAFRRFRERPPDGLAARYEAFRIENSGWLLDDALFSALKAAHGGAPWSEWPRPLAQREPRALARWRAEHAERVDAEEFAQFLFARQWEALRERARARGLSIMGDLPMFVAYDSADVWAQREWFQLDGDGRPKAVAGVPPDYFSEDGQLWGNPVYDWDALAASNFRWWLDRLGRALALTDAARLDHFRGLCEYWAVPPGDDTARGGRWEPAPGRALLAAARERFGGLPLVAEDLGHITPDVIALRQEFGLPGMAILQFAFDPAVRGAFLPYNHRRDLVVYTGTHDNNTTRGWLEQDASPGEREFFRRYTGCDGTEPHWAMIRLALASVADLAIVPHQDLAGLGSEARMNAPGTTGANWGWRLLPAQLDGASQARFRALADTYGRLPPAPPNGDDLA